MPWREVFVSSKVSQVRCRCIPVPSAVDGHARNGRKDHSIGNEKELDIGSNSIIGHEVLSSAGIGPE